MKSRYLIFFVFCFLVWNRISLVQTADTCENHDDCKANNYFRYCCGTWLNPTRRTCQLTNCLDKYCTTESHCGNPSFCCLSNKCVDRGCSGCASDSDCSLGHVCCKKTFPKDETVCAENCIDQDCNKNDDCAGRAECCRNKKCVSLTSCTVYCKDNSECDLGKYCCRKEPVLVFWKGHCRESCVGTDCNSNDDCGHPNECCIADKCSSDCSPDKLPESSSPPPVSPNPSKESSNPSKESSNPSKESSNPSKESSNPSKESSNPSKESSNPSKESSNPNSKELSNLPKESSPPWRIAVIVIAGFIVLGVSIAVYWQYKRNQQIIATQVNRGFLPNIQNQGTVIANPKPNPQFTGYNNPTQQQITASAPPLPGVDRYCGQQDMLDNDGYVISPDDTYEYPTVVRVTQRQSNLNAFNPYDNPPPYPGNHP